MMTENVNFGSNQPKPEPVAPSLDSFNTPNSEQTVKQGVGNDGLSMFAPTDIATGLFGTGTFLSSNPGSDQLHRAKEVCEIQLKKISERLRREHQVKLFALDRTEHSRLPFGCLVMAYHNTAHATVGHSFHVIVLSGNSGPVIRNENRNGQNYEKMTLPGDAIRQVINEVRGIMKDRFPGRWLSASGIEVNNSTFDWESEQQVYQLLVHGSNACIYELLQRTTEFNDMNLSRMELAGGDLEVVIQRARGQTQPRDLLGRPKRRDLDVQLRTRQVVNNQTGEVIQQAEPICALSVYGDLLWDPVAVQTLNPYGQPMQEIRPYRPRLVITSARNVQAATLGCQLMNLIPALTMVQDKVVQQAFIPAADSKPHSSDDIGTLNIEAKIDKGGPGSNEKGEWIDVYSEIHLIGKYIERLLSPSVELAMDIDVAGPDYNINQVLLKAALAQTGNVADEDLAKAYKKVIATMIQLTNGKFSTFWKGGQIAWVDSILEVGHYTNREGGLEDSRNVDTIAVANKFLETSPNYHRIWSDAQIPQNHIPIEARQRDIRSVIEHVVPPVTYTTRVFRIIFTKEFLEAYVQSIAALGLRLHAVLPNETRQDDRLVYGMNAGMLPSGIASQLFSAGYTNVGNGMPGMGIGAGNRWSF